MKIPIYPNQLIYDEAILSQFKHVELIENPALFTQFHFHKQKLIYHRATMKAYEKWLTKLGITVSYVSFDQVSKSKKVTPPFLTPEKDLPSSDKLFFHSFYIAQRKRFDLLIEGGKPVGGKWSFDPENRKPLPKSLKLPKRWTPPQREEVKEAIKYVEKHFPNNPGTSAPPLFPVTRKDALTWFDHFLKECLPHFGEYEDAIRYSEVLLFHSGLSPMLNTGLLTPVEVIEGALEAKKVPLPSLEGFIRQVIGWREFIYGVYKNYDQQASNFFKHQKKIPSSFWTAKTGIAPIDLSIEKVLKHGYLHHIERLMVVGCFMLLCEFDPSEVYKWFMELFIDSDEWVMVPNVFGMSQYADGGLMTTKPYLCSSNYLKKMGDYPKGEWEEIWDGLFWRFLYKHEKTLKKNPRLGVLYKHDKASKKPLIKKADVYLQSLVTS